MGQKGRKPPAAAAQPAADEPVQTAGVRIIGGQLRGRKLEYGGDPRTRPMKDRVREALFNRLGPRVKGKTAVDLFAGTGALGIEAISRGAARAVLIERHIPTAKAIRRGAAALGIAEQVEVFSADTFIWSRRELALGSAPWVVFCSPPYALYTSRTEDMLGIITRLLTAAPSGSIFAVEADEQFDFGLLPDAEAWDVRPYLPAVVGLYTKPEP